MNTPQIQYRLFSGALCVALLSIATLVAARNLAAQQPSPPAVSGQISPEAQAFVSQQLKLDNGTVEMIPPSVADPEIKRFDKPNYALFNHGVRRDAPLLVFFPGTGSEPKASWPFLVAGADAGYRVIGLMYDNGVSDPQTCGPNPDPACSDRFREKRIFGDGASSDIDDLPAESVVNRLVKFLQFLDAQHPGEGWGGYLLNGQPNWARIAVSGHSQGGGVAAYIGKKRSVYRVINLSGAWDRVEATKQWAPWITSPSATPLDRWYCAYHAKESRADAMKAAYAVMQIPPDHIRVLTLEPNPANTVPKGADVYHVSMSATGVTPRDANGKPAYAADWAFLLGAAK
jgi:hypothetical protein